MSSLEEQIADLKSKILDNHEQIIKAVNICTADKHIIHVSRLCTRISLNYLRIIENKFIFKKKTIQPNSFNPGKVTAFIASEEDIPEIKKMYSQDTEILVDILTKKGE